MGEEIKRERERVVESMGEEIKREREWWRAWVKR